MPTAAPPVELVDRPEALPAVVERLGQARELAVDLESNGLFAYAPRLCTLQMLDVGGGPVVVVDPLRWPDEALAPLRPLLGEGGPRKVVHDLSFDARIMLQHGLELANVFDTALAARFLGVQATGLASLAQARLGLTLSKKMQHHDWGKRPLHAEALAYLSSDVNVLPPLASQLQAEIAAKDLLPALDEEIRFRLASARADRENPDPRPPYVRFKEADKLTPQALAILRELAQVREDESRRLNVPPFKVLDNAVLLGLAQQPPASRAALAGVRGLQHPRAQAVHDALWAAVERGLAARDIPSAERGQFFTELPRLPRAQVTAMRQRESRLMAWRKAEAKKRGVDEQAILPGHVLRRLADEAPETLEALAQVAGLGSFRVAREGAALLTALRG